MAAGRFALIVATDEHVDPDIGQLTAPRQDAKALAEVLSHPSIGAFEVKSLVNAQAHIVRHEIEVFFSDRKRDDTLLLYFSGHGIKDAEGNLHFVASNTHRRWLQSTGVAAAFVNEVMQKSRSRQQILLIDSCYSGAFARGMVVKSDDKVQVGEAFSQGTGRAVITASDAMQYSFEGDVVKGSSPGSVFTRHLIQGLKSGEADQDNDGWVSFEEMYDYLYQRVTLEMPEQVPRKWVFDVKGDLIVARNANPRAADLPPEIKRALADSNRFVREGAVSELGTLLGSDHPGLVKAARLALRRLAEGDDSRSVSSLATRLLGKHEVAPLDPMSGGEQMPGTAADTPVLSGSEAARTAFQPKPQNAGESPVAGAVVEQEPPPKKSILVSNAPLIHAFVWASIGVVATVTGWDIPAPALFGAFCGLCSGWVSGFVANRLVHNPPDNVAMRIALGWAITLAVMFGLLASDWFWAFREASVFSAPLAAAAFAMLGGFNMSSALMSARSPDWNRRLLALNAVGWAAAFFLGYAMTPFWYLMFGGVLYSPVIVWLVIAILGTLVHLTMISQLNKGRIA